MATRLTTRLSAGAALVTGLGMIGLASAAPAHAEVTGSLEYTCEETGQNPELDDPWTVDFTLDIEERVEQGATIPAAPLSATVTPGDDAAELLRGLGVEYLQGTANTSYTFGEEGEQRDVELDVPQSDIPAEGPIEVTATGESVEETAPSEDVAVPIIAGDFTAQLENQDGFVFQIECTAPEDATAGHVAVGDAELPEPPADEEPPAEEPPAEEPPAEEPPADEPPADEPPAEDEDGDDVGAGGDAAAGDPEIPGVVQTDGGAGAAGADTATIALGGALLAGAGAGAVVVARRRAAQH